MPPYASAPRRRTLDSQDVDARPRRRVREVDDWWSEPVPSAMPAAPLGAGDDAPPAGPRAGPTNHHAPVQPRRTVTITGRGDERYRAGGAYGRAPGGARRSRERPGRAPDRVAMWAVLLGIALAVGAATSSHAAVLTHIALTAGH
jgi:hypothetical protein